MFVGIKLFRWLFVRVVALERQKMKFLAVFSQLTTIIDRMKLSINENYSYDKSCLSLLRVKIVEQLLVRDIALEGQKFNQVIHSGSWEPLVFLDDNWVKELNAVKLYYKVPYPKGGLDWNYLGIRDQKRDYFDSCQIPILCQMSNSNQNSNLTHKLTQLYRVVPSCSLQSIFFSEITII